MSTSAAEIVGGRYEIIRTLGQGAFGHTFLARDREDDRTVAIKLLDTRGRVDPKAYELFRREAEVLRAVRHHGIPEVYDTLQDVWYGAPATFLVMEYIEGTSLAQIIDDKRSLEGSDVVHLFLELLGILDYLHGRVPPILHRDIKPSNIILRPNGFPALVDFGSVRRVFMSLEESGSTVAGTYGYMPYEQYMGQASPASDLFATAATLLHLLTGRAPREFMNDEGRIQVPEILPSEPRLRSVIARLLRPSPTERFASARDVRNALVGGAGNLGHLGSLAGGSEHLGSPEGSGVMALTPFTKSTLQRASPTIDAVNALPPAPRELKGDTKSLMKRASPSTLRLLYASEKGYDDFGLIDVLTLTFFSVVTAGILPVVYANMASTRRRRMRRFFRDGEAAIAEVTKIDTEKMPFDEKIARVNYQFHADGQIHRDSDTVLPSIANRWQPGDQIPVLYLRDRDYDSVIVAVE